MDNDRLSNAKTRNQNRQPIAIVGIGCRYPGGVTSPEQFWELLVQGVDAISEVPEDRFSLGRYYHEDPKRVGRLYARWGGFVENFEDFDAGFFNISPREASRMDPQHRAVMEVSYSALEDAGEAVDKLAGSRTGVYVGISTYDYGGMQGQPSEERLVDTHTNLGGALSIAAARVSYEFDFKGPSLSVDTACSSSLVAVHLACQSIWGAESDMALVAGVNYLLSWSQTMGFCKASMLSPDGRCKPFDSRANGYVRAEGCGVIVLKPLDRALADGNPIYATIRGTGVNQDGHSSSIVVPSSISQQRLMEEVLREAGIDPLSVQYVEAHGTGTPVGDPIEAGAIGQVLGRRRGSGERCLIGSVKSNIGHLEAGSGVAGIIKVALSLKHGTIPPTLHYLKANPDINFDGLGLHVVDTLSSWPESKGPRTAGVNSFGFGGTNAHVVLEEAPRLDTSEDEPDHGGASLLCLSARSQDSLEALAESYRRFLIDPAMGGNASVERICHSAFYHRSHHELRLAVAANSRQEMAEYLGAYGAGEKRLTMTSGRPAAGDASQVVFVFSGMGPQWWGMGRELLDEEPVFRRTFEECAALLAERTGWSLLEELAADESRSHVQETRIAQPAIFALQVGLARLWRSWGVEPSAIVGHSVGEVAAAHISGALSLEAAVDVIFHRSRLQHTTEGQGKMLAVGLPADEARALFSEHDGAVGIAAVNSPRGVTLSGSATALEEIDRSLQTRGVFSRFLRVSVPYHSPKMEPIRDELLTSLRELDPQPTSIPLYSTAWGRLIGGQELTADYWWRNVREPVLFSDAMTALLAAGANVFLEIAAHPVLSAVISECLAAANSAARIRHSLRRQEPERATMLASLGGLYVDGYPVEWDRSGRCSAGFVKLPGYPWQREHFWMESEASRKTRLAAPEHPLLGERLSTAQWTWSALIDPSEPAFLEDHRVRGAIVFPAAGFLDMALAAAREALGEGPIVLEAVDILKSLVLRPGEATRVQFTLESDNNSFKIHSRPADSQGSWDLHVTGYLRLSAKEAVPEDAMNGSVSAWEEVPLSRYYERFEAVGLNFGSAFRRIEKLWTNNHQTHAEISALRPGENTVGYVFHPPTLDACLQTAGGARLMESDALFLPVHVRRMKLHASPAGRTLARAKLLALDGGTLDCEIKVHTEAGEKIADIEGFRCRMVGYATSRTGEDASDHLFRYRWRLRSPNGARPVPPILSTEELRARMDERVRRWSDEFATQQHATRTVPVLENWLRLRIAEQMTQDAWPAQGEVAQERRGLLAQVKGFVGDAALPDGRGGSADGWRNLLAAQPESLAELVLLRRYVDGLPDLLRGKLSEAEILCPDGDSAATEHLLHDGPTFRLHNTILCEALQAVVESCPSDRDLRILALGTDAGRLATPLLCLRAGTPIEAVVATTSDTGVPTAQPGDAAVSIEYLEVDPAEPLTDQNLQAASFDIVILSDGGAWGSTPDGLESVRRVLASGGLLLASARPHLPPGLSLAFAPLLEPEKPSARATTILDEDALASAGFVEAAGVSRQDGSSEKILYVARNSEVVAETGPVELERSGEPGTWLLLCDDKAFSTELAGAFENRGLTPITVEPGDRFEQVARARFRIRPDQPDDMRRLIAQVLAGDPPCSGVVHLWSLAAASAVTDDSDRPLTASYDLVSTSALHLVQSLNASGTPVPRLHFVTRGAEVAGGTAVTSPAAGALWGLARVVMNEHQALQTCLIDLEPTPTPGEAQRLVQELLSGQLEGENALRSGHRWVHRLEPVGSWQRRSADVPAGPKERNSDRCVKLKIGTPGILQTLTFKSVPRERPGPGRVEIAVCTAALNFKDVAKAMGLLGDTTLEHTASGRELGLECAGTITAVGEGVTDFRVGDDVVGFATHSLGSHAISDARLIGHRPKNLSCEASATLMTVAMTAHYALNTLGQIQSGEKVLIHSATGGVGLAAIQLARAAGAEVFATAGSPAKRELLRYLGVEHVMDSRSLSFASEVMEATGGRGVDVVLNSLTGEAIRKGLSVLAPFGRFIEIGKRDIEADQRVGLRPFQENLSFFAADLDRLCVAKPELAARLRREVLTLVEAGTLSPLPYRAFPAARVRDAFRFMAKARHAGKVVVSMSEVEELAAPDEQDFALREDATYMVTGGLSGFGLATTEWLARRGAKHLVLVGRSGVSSPEARAAVEDLTSRGIEVVVARADVSDSEQVKRVLTDIASSMPPLRGVVHSAMVLDDATLTNLDVKRLRTVLEPKASGAWNVHRLTLDHSLDFLVMYSSIASVFGNPGQANYSAANAFLDALSHHRQSRNLPSLTVNWGAIADVGVAARSGTVQDHFERLGIQAIHSEKALSILGRLLTRGERQCAVSPPSDWRLLSQFLPALKSPRFAPMLASSGSMAESEEGEQLVTRLLAHAPEERIEIVQAHLCRVLAGVLGTSPERLDVERPVTELGMDSLMVVEIVSRLQADAGVEVPPAKLMEGTTIAGLASFLVDEIAAANSATSGVAP